MTVGSAAGLADYAVDGREPDNGWQRRHATADDYDNKIDGRYILVLLDLKPPRVNGMEVLRKVRADERSRFVPIVVLTSFKEREDVLTSYRVGANTYVRKAVNYPEFSEAIKILGLSRLLLNHTATG